MIIGNLTRDPETRSLPSGQTVCSFGVATNRIWKDSQSGERKQAVEYHNIVAWGRLAETCQQYLHKGSKVYIEGRLQTRTWDGQDGVKRNRTEIVAGNMIMLDSAGSRGSAAVPSAPAEPAASQPKSDDSSQPAPAPDEEEINVEEIPF